MTCGTWPPASSSADWPDMAVRVGSSSVRSRLRCSSACSVAARLSPGMLKPPPIELPPACGRPVGSPPPVMRFPVPAALPEAPPRVDGLMRPVVSCPTVSDPARSRPSCRTALRSTSATVTLRLTCCGPETVMTLVTLVAPFTNWAAIAAAFEASSCDSVVPDSTSRSAKPSTWMLEPGNTRASVSARAESFGVTETSSVAIWRPASSMKKILVSPIPVPARMARRCERIVAEAMLGCDTITSRALAGRSMIIDLLSPSDTWRATGLAVAMVRCVLSARAAELSETSGRPASSATAPSASAERGRWENGMGRFLAIRLVGRDRRGAGRRAGRDGRGGTAARLHAHDGLARYRLREGHVGGRRDRGLALVGAAGGNVGGPAGADDLDRVVAVVAGVGARRLLAEIGHRTQHQRDLAGGRGVDQRIGLIGGELQRRDRIAGEHLRPRIVGFLRRARRTGLAEPGADSEHLDV